MALMYLLRVITRDSLLSPPPLSLSSSLTIDLALSLVRFLCLSPLLFFVSLLRRRSLHLASNSFALFLCISIPLLLDIKSYCNEVPLGPINDQLIRNCRHVPTALLFSASSVALRPAQPRCSPAGVFVRSQPPPPLNGGVFSWPGVVWTRAGSSRASSARSAGRLTERST